METEPRPSFWRDHASAFFAASILLVSLLLVLLSVWLQEPFASFLSHLAAMTFAAFVAATFFNFNDVQDVVSSSISRLLIEGDIVRHFSSTKRRQLQRRALATDLQEHIESLPDALYEHTDAVQRHALTVAHVLNYSPTISLADIPNRPGLLRRHYRCTYTVSTRHLKGGKGVFPLRLRHELTDPTGHLDPALLKAFEIHVGGTTYGISDAKITQRQSGGTKVTLISFDKDIEVVGEATVSISSEAVSSTIDPTEILFAWYPTKGFRVTLLYREDMTYDVAWFRAWTTGAADYPGREQVVLMPTGITAYTDEWLLPGHGVILYWFPRVTEGISPTLPTEALALASVASPPAA